MIVQDQYGEQVQIGINVVAPPRQNFSTWPASLVLGAGGTPVASSTNGIIQISDRKASFTVAIGPVLNALLAGGVARAQTMPYTGPCYAQAFLSGASGLIDASLPGNVAGALGVSVTTDGCILNADGSAPYGGSTASGCDGRVRATADKREAFTLARTAQMSRSAPGIRRARAARRRCFRRWNDAGHVRRRLYDGTSTQTSMPDAGQVAVIRSADWHHNDHHARMHLHRINRNDGLQFRSERRHRRQRSLQRVWTRRSAGCGTGRWYDRSLAWRRKAARAHGLTYLKGITQSAGATMATVSVVYVRMSVELNVTATSGDWDPCRSAGRSGTPRGPSRYVRAAITDHTARANHIARGSVA